jgi:hypothetical protein
LEGDMVDGHESLEILGQAIGFDRRRNRAQDAISPLIIASPPLICLYLPC